MVSRGVIQVDPYDPSCVGPNSLDVHLHPRMLRYCQDTWRGEMVDDVVIDARHPPKVRAFDIPESGMVLRPGQLYLGRTVERTYTPLHVPKIGGRSSTGRLGLNVHQTAGFGDLGFQGSWTLELSVVQPVRVYPGMRIGQIWFFDFVGELEQYKGQYQNQVNPEPSGGVF